MLKEKVRNISELEKYNLLDAEQREEIEKVLEKFSMAITPHILETINQSDNDGAVAAQFVPSVLELNEHPAESEDPIGDAVHSPLPGIIHRYKDRLLLNVIQTCAVYCRFCFRRENVGPGNGGLTPGQLDSALEYISEDENIWEVILSGGDPLTLAPRRLADIMRRLAAISHVGIVRFHTRIPTVAPEKITSELIAALKQHPATYVVIHVNHADELTPGVAEKLAVLVDAGIPLLSQTVLLKGLNDCPKVLTGLFKTLLVNRVKPYYLHHGDLAKGTSHFRTSISRGQEIMKEMRGPVSGLCQPHYVLDVPGGHGKIPIGPQFIEQVSANGYEIMDINGKKQHYEEAIEI